MNPLEQNKEVISFSRIKEYFYLLVSWAWVIVLAGAVAGAAAYIISIRTTPIYQTTARLLVSEPPAVRSLDNSTMINVQLTTSTYAEMLTDQIVLQGVIDKLGLQIKPARLQGAVSVAVVKGTQLLEITVEDPDPAQAVAIADTLGKVFALRIHDLQSQRYASTQEGLAKQVSDIENQINITSLAQASEKDPVQKLQIDARLVQYRNLYSSLVTNFEQIRLAEVQTSTNVVIAQPAVFQTAPVRPRTMLNVIVGIFTGMLLAVALIFGIEALDDTIKNPDDIRQNFNLSILGMISNHEMADQKPISQTQPRSPVAEAFRSMRTNITFASVDRPLRRILITSPTPQDGKTTVSSNLAVVLANSEKKVVLLDADLRRPQIHSKFGLVNRAGLSELFVHDLDSLKDVIQFGDASELGVITSGGLPPNPSELLTSNKMIQILDRINQDYDLILIDTPPVLSVTDAVALAPRMDGVILVIKPGKTRQKDLQQTIEELNGVGAHILGVVLNNVNTGSRKYGYYYGQYHSKYSHYYRAA